MKNKEHIIMKRIILLLAIVGAGMFQSVRAQDVALKTNLLSDGFLSPNLGVEIGLAPKWTLDLSGQFNAWTLSHDRRWKHWLVQPEARWWFCNAFADHFVGLHLLGGQYNVGHIDTGLNFLGTNFSILKNRRVQGWAVGAGIAYGYAWILGRHWNLEAEIGLGYVYTHYDVFNCAGCGRKIETDKPHHYVGPTKAAINLVYLF